jgi:hypothetical protein
MERVRWLVLLAVLGVGVFAFLVTRPAADAPVPAGIERVTVDFARGMARDALGAVGLILPIRFVEARCAEKPEGHLVLYAFEAADPSIRSYAVHFSQPPVPDVLDDVSTIGGFNEEDFAAGFSGTNWTACV